MTETEAPSDAAEIVDWPDDEAGAIAAHFAGQAALFSRFKAGCLAQFAAALRDGEAADSPALEHAAALVPPDWPALATRWQIVAAARRRLRAADGLGDRP